MGDQAIQLAQQVNQRQADEHVKAQLQVQRASVLRSKGHEAWNRFAITFREEIIDFNTHLNSDEYAIGFDDRNESYKIKMHNKAGVSVTCYFDIEGQKVSLVGHRPISDARLDASFRLTVDNDDNVVIQEVTKNVVIGPSEIAIDAIRFFAR